MDETTHDLTGRVMELEQKTRYLENAVAIHSTILSGNESYGVAPLLERLNEILAAQNGLSDKFMRFVYVSVAYAMIMTSGLIIAVYLALEALR